MRMPKKVISSIALVVIAGGSMIGVTTLHARQQLSAMAVADINYNAECDFIDLALGLLAGLGEAVMWVAQKIRDKWNESFGQEAMTDGANDGKVKVNLPKLKRHVNFIVIKNKTQSPWTFQVADLSKEEIAGKNEKNLPEVGTVAVFKINMDAKGNPDKQAPIGFVAILDAGGDKLPLEPGVDYIFYPNIEGKVGGVKWFAKDFNRTVYLEDSNQKKYAFNLNRPAKSGAKTTFGVTFNSYSAVMADRAVEWNNDPKFDDMYFITKDKVTTQPKLPN
jgi:hypothetical protein